MRGFCLLILVVFGNTSFPQSSLAAKLCTDVYAEKNHREIMSEVNIHWRETVGSRVKDLTDGVQNMSIKELAEELGIPLREFYQIRNGGRAPTPYQAEILAEYSGVKASWIMASGILRNNSKLLASLNGQEQWWFSSIYWAYEVYGPRAKSRKKDG